MAKPSELDTHALRDICANLPWPKALEQNSEAKFRIIEGVCRGLGSYHNLFGGYAYEHASSEVHDDSEAHKNACELCVVSWRREHTHENSRRAQITALIHQLDDIVDSGHARDIFTALQQYSAYGPPMKVHNSRGVFRCIYKDLITDHMDDDVYLRMIRMIDHMAPGRSNRRFLYWGLNRLGIGAVMFSPLVDECDRETVLCAHNAVLMRMIPKKHAWERKLRALLGRMRKERVGNILLGLTIKTVMECIISIESGPFSFPLSLMRSILFAPLIYLCNAREEVERGEMVALPEFETKFGRIIGWLEELKVLCEETRELDDRFLERTWQLEMVFRCHEQSFPKYAREGLRHIYVMDEN